MTPSRGSCGAAARSGPDRRCLANCACSWHADVTVRARLHACTLLLPSQGVFVKRHQILKEEDGSPLTPADLAVGQLITIYGRTFFVVDADNFTREWYAQQLGLQLAAAETYPADPVDAYRQHFGLDKTPSERQPGHRAACRFSRHIVPTVGTTSGALATPWRLGSRLPWLQVRPT